MSEEQTYKDQKTVSQIAITHVLIVFLIKILSTLFTRSLSFYTELSDSILDFLAVSITFFALKESRKPADNEHMYGHYKINSIAGLFQSFLIIGLYFFILYNAISILFFNLGDYTTVNGFGAAISLIVILGLVFFDSQIIIKIGKKSNNPLIIAQGANFRGDFYRNITFIIGLIVASSGLYIIDVILASIFSSFSIFQGLKVFRHSLDELLDTNKENSDLTEAVKNEIKALPGVENLDGFAIKTAGNNLDAKISISVNHEKSLFSANEMSTEIKKIMAQKFRKYLINAMIQFNSEPILNKKSTDYLFETVRKIADDEIGISSLHNFTLDVYRDKILIQFHVDVDSSLRLKDAHDYTSKIEHNIVNRLKEDPDLKQHIEIITHLEPARIIKKEHSHVMDHHLLPASLELQIINCVSRIPGVQKVKSIKVLEEDQSLYLIITVGLPSDQTLEKSHVITDQIENLLYLKLTNLKRCVVHAEPAV